MNGRPQRELWTRRSLLAAAGAGGVLGVGFLLKRFGFVASEDRPPPLKADRPPGFLIGGAGRKFCRIDLESRACIEVATGCYGHSFTPWPTGKQHFFGIERKGNSAAIVSFDAQKVVGEFKAPEGRIFYGHVAALFSREELFFTQASTETGAGYIAVAEAATLRTKREYRLSTGGLHQAIFLASNPKILAVSSAGTRFQFKNYQEVPNSGVKVEDSSILFFDIEAEKVVDQFFLRRPGELASHLFDIGAERLLLNTTVMVNIPGTAAARSGSLYLVDLKARSIQELPIPPEVRRRMNFEFLSLAYDKETGICAATNPKGGMVLFFDLLGLRLLGVVEGSFLGVALNEQTRKFLLSSDLPGGILRSDAEVAALVSDYSGTHQFDSSHLTWVSG